MFHAIGNDTKRPPWRNYFVVSPNTNDDLEWKKIVEMGFAQHFKTSFTGDMNGYLVTKKGFEELDKEEILS